MGLSEEGGGLLDGEGLMVLLLGLLTCLGPSSQCPYLPFVGRTSGTSSSCVVGGVLGGVGGCGGNGADIVTRCVERSCALLCRNLHAEPQHL